MKSKRKDVSRIRGIWAGLITIGLLAGCGKSEPQFYEVKEVQEKPTIEEVDHSGHDHSGHDHAHHEMEAAGSGLGFTYSLPEGWSELPLSPMVILSLQAGEPPELVATVSVSSFPGDVGGQLANVNRWRRQVGLGPVAPEALDGFITATEVSDIAAWQVDFTGPAGSAAEGQPMRMVVTAVSHDGQTWFFKMVGPESAVAEELDAYQAFLNTVRF